MLPSLARFARLLVLCLAVAGCGGSAVGSSPHAVFDRAKACSAAGDWAGLYGYIAPAKREGEIGTLIYLAMFTRMGGDSAEAEYTRVMTSHGLDPDPPRPDPAAAPGAQLAQWLAPAKDRAKLFADLVVYTQSTRKPSGSILDPSATLEDLQVTGDAATGKLVTPDGRKKTIRFTKDDEAWYLE